MKILDKHDVMDESTSVFGDIKNQKAQRSLESLLLSFPNVFLVLGAAQGDLVLGPTPLQLQVNMDNTLYRPEEKHVNLI